MKGWHILASDSQNSIDRPIVSSANRDSGTVTKPHSHIFSSQGRYCCHYLVASGKEHLIRDLKTNPRVESLRELLDLAYLNIARRSNQTRKTGLEY